MSLVLSSLTDDQVIKMLQKGAVGIIPTDTVYGLVCAASNQEAVARLYSIKRRENKPGTAIAAHIDQFVNLGVKTRYLKAVELYWPNPISVEIPFSTDYLSQGTGRLAFRIPNSAALRKLLEEVGPLQTTSANQPGEPVANNIEEAKRYFGDRIDFYVDGGDLSDREPSTVIRIVDDEVEVLREGAVKINANGEIET